MKKPFLSLMASAAFALLGCNQTTEPTSLSLKANTSSVSAQVLIDGESCVKLIAGQTNVIGTVCNVVDGGDLVVTYSTNSGMDNVYTWAGTVWGSWPKKAKNNPSPAHASFPYLSGNLNGAKSYTVRIPLSTFGIDSRTFCGSKTIYIIGHASGPAGTAFGAFSPKNLDVSGGGNWAYGYSLVVKSPPPPVIAFADTAKTYTVGDTVSLAPASTGGPILSCDVTPALPAGLSLNGACGISGIVIAASDAQTYSVTAMGQCGNSTATLNITVCPPPPVISLSTSSVTAQTGAPVSVSASSLGGPILGCSVSPALPAGLFLSASCGIEGSSATVSSETYTVTAQGPCASTSASVSINVIAPPPPPPVTPPTICYGSEESATGAGTKVGTNWFMVTPVTGGSASVNLLASRTKVAGTVNISGGVVTVTLDSGWAFDSASVISIGGFNSLPSGNIAPGQQPYQIAATGSSVTSAVVVSGKPYVFVHANVRAITACAD